MSTSREESEEEPPPPMITENVSDTDDDSSTSSSSLELLSSDDTSASSSNSNNFLNTIIDPNSPCGSFGASGLTGGYAAVTNGGALGIQYKRPKKISKYICGAVMGEGTYGTVRDAIDLNKNTMERVAIKVLRTPKEDTSLQSNDEDSEEEGEKKSKRRSISAASDRKRKYELACIDNEIEMLQRFHHPNVIRATDIFTRNDKNYVVLPVAVCSLERFIAVRLEKMNKAFNSDAYSSTSTITSVASTIIPNRLNEPLIYRGSNIRFSSRQLCPSQLVKDIAVQLLTGVSYIHLQKCYHNDLKPSNVLLFGDGTVKVADFGCCGSNFEVGKHGTPVYISPQVVANLIGHELPGVVSASEPIDPAKNDVWACGCILYQLLTGMVPVACLSPDKIMMREIDGESFTEFNIYNSIVKDEINFDAIPVESDIKDPKADKSKANEDRKFLEGLGRGTSSARDLVMKLLDKNQKKRITISHALEHPWMKEAVMRSPRAVAALTPTKPDKPKTNKNSSSSSKKIEDKHPNKSPLLSFPGNGCNFIEHTIMDPQGYICPPPYDNANLLPLTGSEKNLRRVFNVREISTLIDRDFIMHVHLVLQVVHILKLSIPSEFLSHAVVPYEGHVDDGVQHLIAPTARSCLYHAIDGRKFMPESEVNYYSKKGKDDRDIIGIRKNPARKDQLLKYMDGITVACEKGIAGRKGSDAIPGNTRGVSSGGVKRINYTKNLPDAMREFFNGYEPHDYGKKRKVKRKKECCCLIC